MPKKSHVRTLMNSQHVKRSETLLKASQQYFCHIFWSLWKKSSSKNYSLVVSELLRLFVNVLIPNDKYCVSVKASVQRNIFKCNFLEIQKYFLNSFLHFHSLHEILNTLKKEMSLRRDLFLKLYTAKSAIT